MQCSVEWASAGPQCRPSVQAPQEAQGRAWDFFCSSFSRATSRLLCIKSPRLAHRDCHSQQLPHCGTGPYCGMGGIAMGGSQTALQYSVSYSRCVPWGRPDTVPPPRDAPLPPAMHLLHSCKHVAVGRRRQPSPRARLAVILIGHARVQLNELLALTQMPSDAESAAGTHKRTLLRRQQRRPQRQQR